MTVAYLNRPFDQVLGRFQIAQRGEPERCAASAAFDLSHHVFGSLFVAPDYQYVSAASGQGDGRRLADPARGARNQSGLALQVSHGCASCRYKMGWVTHSDTSGLGCQTQNPANIGAW